MQLQAEDLDLAAAVQYATGNTRHSVVGGSTQRDLLEIPMPLEVLCMIAFGRKERREPASLMICAWKKSQVDKI